MKLWLKIIERNGSFSSINLRLFRGVSGHVFLTTQSYLSPDFSFTKMDCLRASQSPLTQKINRLEAQALFHALYLVVLFTYITNYHSNNISNHIYKIHQISRLRSYLIDFIYCKYLHFSSTLYPSFLLPVSKGKRKLMEVLMAGVFYSWKLPSHNICTS